MCNIVFATERFEHYLIGKDKVTVLTDHKPLTSIFKKAILNSPKRLQRMRLALLKYPVEVIYKPGSKMFISDTLSRASLPNASVREAPDYLIFNLQAEDAIRREIEEVKSEVFVTDERIQMIQEETQKDPTMQTLLNVVMQGWPSDKADVPLCIQDYWLYRDELAAQDGLALRGTRIIIPSSLRKTMTERAHAAHLGIQYTVNTAREIMYWPLMHRDLTEAVQSCNVCQETQDAQGKEPMMSYPLSQHPWQVVASDCFELKGKHYVVLADVYSDYIEVCQLPNMSVHALIDALEPIFATEGSPALVISDNGTNYAAEEFKRFAQEWGFKHQTSSPHHP